MSTDNALYPQKSEIWMTPIDLRLKILVNAAAHFMYAMSGAFKALGKALEEYAK
jgi:hypothetical protein